MRTPALVVAAALSLAACGSPGPVADADAAVPAGAVAEGSGNDATSDKAPRVTSDVLASAAVPAIFHGRWGKEPADCTPTVGKATGLMLIGPAGLRFQEAQGRPAGNIKTSTDSFSGDFAFTGAGQSWSKYQTLELQDGRLVRTESSPMVSYTYVRCS